MKEKVKVCWYCEKWQPGGIQAVQVNLLQHMDYSSLDFDLVVSEDDTALFDDKLEALGVNKIVSLKKKYDSPGKRVLANIFAVKNILKKGHYDVVHFNACHGVELIYVFWAWLYRVPVRIVHCRNNDIGAGGKSRGIKILCHNICKMLFKNCGNVKLANSDLAAEWLFGKKQLKSGAVQILNNGIDARKYSFNSARRGELRKAEGITDNFVVGHIGHFNYQKNHEFLLHVFNHILKKKSNAVLLMIGAGEREPEIRKLAEELGIERHVIYGGVTNDIPSVLNMMDVFVFPSRFEGFGNVLIEAQASGLHCFASQGVIPEAVCITDKLHWVSLQQSYQEWADIILKYAHDQKRESCVEQVIGSGYDISSMSETLEKLYHM